MKRKILIFSILITIFSVIPLQAQLKIETYTYDLLNYDDDVQGQRFTSVERYGNRLMVRTPKTTEHPIPGLCEEYIYVDYDLDSVYYEYDFGDSCYYSVSSLRRDNIQWDTQIVDSKTTRYVTSINSNRIELLFAREKKGASVNPLPYYGRFEGVLQEMVRNGLALLRLKGVQKGATTRNDFIPKEMGERKSAREIDNLKRERMVLTTQVFKDAQICWGKEKPALQEIPFDTVLHYAGGTLILKRLQMPKLPEHYQTFIELRQRSNGDAYDRTGSVFVIPRAGEQGVPTFLDGILYHPDSLPVTVGRDGERYQGIVQALSPMHKYRSAPSSYSPPVELMRFFTPFGVGKFNDRVRLDGLEWEEETFYNQEVTELKGLLEGDVFIGVFIGNYDGGGHRVSLDIKSYPNDYEWTIPDEAAKDVVSLINTCNVLEMAGQNYGKIFGTDSLTVDFYTEGDETGLTLRYLSTGHGGWGGGDEFNPKENEILIDGAKRYSHTPWRCDCARYREWNPVSGNFWNGLSSSDLSRSGWCPGTATQPVFFDLTGLAPGRHTLTIAIPQGKPMEGGFSHWSASAALIYEYKTAE